MFVISGSSSGGGDGGGAVPTCVWFACLEYYKLVGTFFPLKLLRIRRNRPKLVFTWKRKADGFEFNLELCRNEVNFYCLNRGEILESSKGNKGAFVA